MENGYKEGAAKWLEEGLGFYHPITISYLKAMIMEGEDLTDKDHQNIQRYQTAITTGRAFA